MPSVRLMPLYLQYYFWLLLVSALIVQPERLFPLRPQQPGLRDDLSRDLFWLAFNTQFLGWMLAISAVHAVGDWNGMLTSLGLPKPESLRLAAASPWWTQAVVFFLLKDVLKWNVHRCLPLVLLGVDDRVVFGLLVFSRVVQGLIYANLNWDWGPCAMASTLRVPFLVPLCVFP